MGGLSVQIGTDFDEYREILLRDRPKQALGAPFDPDIQNLNAGNAFWLTGCDLDGDLMHTQAARLLDLKHENLGGYMFNRFREFPPAIPDIDLDRSRFRASPGARNITGRVIYHGEVWMSDKPGLFRGNGLSTVLARYGLLTAMQRWNPDYILGSWRALSHSKALLSVWDICTMSREHCGGTAKVQTCRWRVF